MANYFYLTLDTTAPSASINLPSYVFDELVFTITSDEELDEWYECYIVDGQHVRHDLNIQHNGTYFYASVNVSDYPEGNLYVYATVRDLVHNTTHKLQALTVKRIFDYLRIKEFDLKEINKINNITIQETYKINNIEIRQ